VARLPLARLILCVSLTLPAEAGAGAFRLVAPDGTVYLTNAPNDPRYQRLRGVSGTDAGWLRVPNPQTPQYLAEISEAAERYGVPQRLVEAVIRAESAYNPVAVSRKGARGLMQLMPDTASKLGVRDSFNPRQNIDGGVRHLRGLMERYGNDLRLTLAAYNAGEQAVTWYGGIPPFPETRRYVDRILLDFGGGDSAGLPRAIFRYMGQDGTVTYTNMPVKPRPVR
jgi:soluble lytic murein transglycosylase-like protein